MREFDFSPLFRSAIGFDRLPSLLDAATRYNGESQGYPPYNIEKLDADSYRIAIAVAGFGPEDLDIEVKDGNLVVTGRNGADSEAESKDVRYLHRGIAGRAFERRFQLADHVEVRNAELVNGMLLIELLRELPEAMKPRRIPIKAGTASIEHKSAA
jgi:molecular chaperone IbpA